MIADESQPPLPPKKGLARRARCVKSQELFLPGETEVWILHGSDSYRLQVTKSGKLILTK